MSNEDLSMTGWITSIFGLLCCFGVVVFWLDGNDFFRIVVAALGGVGLLSFGGFCLLDKKR